jgi:hypothetical protein
VVAEVGLEMPSNEPLYPIHPELLPEFDLRLFRTTQRDCVYVSRLASFVIREPQENQGHFPDQGFGPPQKAATRVELDPFDAICQRN